MILDLSTDLAQFHDHVHHRGAVEDLFEFNDVGVLDALHDRHLQMQRLQLLRADPCEHHRLAREGDLRLLVDAPVDGSEPTLSQPLLMQLVTVEDPRGIG